MPLTRALAAVALLALGLVACRAPAAPRAGMVRVPAGRFREGTDSGFAYEGPAHEVETKAYWIDATEVTNDAFARFVAATGYATEAERDGWSVVFDERTGLWTRVEGADWRHPLGPKSSVDGRGRFPVVQVSWDDAAAYAAWAGKRLPTEAEWERAARGGLEGAEYAWGDELDPGGRAMANTWQGGWPTGDAGEDGAVGVAEVASYAPNGYGLYDTAGNVWEWVADRFAPYGAPAAGDERVIRGGSFLCSERACAGFRVAARNKTAPDSPTNHLGFRCAADS